MTVRPSPPGKVGILGGTFDPVHLGHLIIAQEAQRLLDLTRVLFVPAGRPWMKGQRQVTPAHHRLAMLRLALASNPAFSVHPVEIDRPGPSYTVDTLLELRQEFGPDVEFVFLIGQDALLDLPRWHQAPRLLDLCRLAALPRPGAPAPDLTRLDEALPGLRANVVFLDKAIQVSISATDIRARVAAGRPIHYLVPEPVAEYIAKEGLYRA